MNRFFSIVMCVLLSGASLFAQEGRSQGKQGLQEV